MNKTILCNNPVEDTIKAWGQVITPVNGQWQFRLNIPTYNQYFKAVI